MQFLNVLKGVKMIRIVISGNPQGKARARTTRYTTYTPKKTVDY